MAEPRFPDGWHWDDGSGAAGAWVLFRGGRYCAWVEPKHKVFVANWRRGPLDWPNPRGENPEHIFRNPYKAMAYAEGKANHTDTPSGSS